MTDARRPRPVPADAIAAPTAGDWTRIPESRPAVRKVVIPAAGLGTRFLPATKEQPKEMLPLVDTPAIQYVVEEAVRSGLRDILVVTGRGKRSIEDHFDRSFELEHYLERAGKLEELAQVRAIAAMADMHYVRQAAPLGLGHAVGIAREHVGDEPFVVMLGDDIMDAESTVLSDMLAVHRAHGCTVLALKEVKESEIHAYGAVDAGPADLDGTLDPRVAERVVRVRGLVEKPAPGEEPSRLAVMGRYVFTPRIFSAIARVTPGKAREIQLTDAIELLLADEPVLGLVFSTGRYDTGNKLEWLKATVALALRRPDLAGAFGDYLRDVVAGLDGRRPATDATSDGAAAGGRQTPRASSGTGEKTPER